MNNSKGRSRRISIETILQEAERRGKEFLRAISPKTPGRREMEELVENLGKAIKRGEKYAPLAREAFAEVSHRFNNPPLGSFVTYYLPKSITPLLRLVGISEHDCQETACINLLNRDVHLNTSFAEELATAAEVPPETIMRGMLEHEMGHYFLHPEHLGLSLYLSFQIKKMREGEAVNLFGLFTDFIVNISVIDHSLGPNLPTLLRAHAAYELKTAEERRQRAYGIIKKAQEELLGKRLSYALLDEDKGILGRSNSVHRNFTAAKPEEVLEQLQPGMFTRYAQPDPVNILRFLATKNFLPQLELPFSITKEGSIVNGSGKPLYGHDTALEEAVCAGVDKLATEHFSVRTSPRSYGMQLGLLTAFYQAYQPLINELRKYDRRNQHG